MTIWKEGLFTLLRVARRGAVCALDQEEEDVVEALLSTVFLATSPENHV